MGQIYGILNTVNKKIYIGKTINTFERRYGLHGIYSVYFQTHNEHLKNSIEKYDTDSWEIHILEDDVETNEELIELEKEYINHFKSYNSKYGYNKTLGGEGAVASFNGPIICINTKEVFYSMADASRKMNIPFTNIASVINGTSAYTGDNVQFDKYEECKTYELKTVKKKEKRIICVNEQKIFNSITEASEFYGIERRNISHALNDDNQYSANGLQFRFYEEGQVYELQEKRGFKKVICINHQLIFNSVTEASENYNIATSTLQNVLNREYKHKGDLFFDYYEEGKDYSIENYNYKPGSKIICINTGKIYDSFKTAGEELFITPLFISKCCRGLQFDTKGYQFAYYEDGKEYKLRKNPKFIKKLAESLEKYQSIHINKKPKFICLNNMKVYSNYKEASEELNISAGSVGECLRGRMTHCKGYQFAYYIPGKTYRLKIIVPFTRKKVICIDDYKVFLNATNASKVYEISSDSIRACCNGSTRSSKGYQFAYYEPGINYELKDLAIINKASKPVICINTSKIYRSGYRASKDLNIDMRAIYSHLRGESPTAEGYQFAYYEYGKEYKLKKVRTPKTQIRCITTGEIFNTLQEASDKYNVVRGNITMVCQGNDRGTKRTFAGVHPKTGEPLKWEYLGEAKTQVSNRAVRCIETGVIYRSLSHAQEETGVQKANIRHVCNGTRKKAGGLTWEYVEGEEAPKYDVRTIRKNPNEKKVLCLNDGLIHNNISLAADYYGIKTASHLSTYLSGKSNTHHVRGYKFVYFDERYNFVLIPKGLK